MSYLSPNRFTFTGTFQADVATVNNYTWNYGEHSPIAPVWNPDGTGRWKFQGCTVQSAFQSGASEPGDPIVNMTLASVPDPVEAKLVDLDPQQQMVSEVWGMKLSLGEPGTANSFTGNFRVAAFCDGFGRNPGLGQGSAAMSAFYQSVIEDIEWGPEITSPVLQQLADGGQTKTLSIKFNVDMHNNFSDPDNPGTQGPTPPGYPVGTYPFTFGRVVGTIGPYEPQEPIHFVSGRLLRPGQGSPLYFAPCLVGSDHIYVDLGNSTPAEVDGSIADQGDLRLAILAPNGVEPDSVTAMKLGLASQSPAIVIFPEPLQYTSYTTDASVLAVPFDASLLPTIESAPLGIVKVDEQGSYQQTLLAESADGWFARADTFVFRLNPGDQAAVRVRATQFGVPAPESTEISLQKGRLSSTGNAESQALTVPQTVVTGSDGWAEFTMTSSDPGYPRQRGIVLDPNTNRPVNTELNLDGQLYKVTPRVVEAVSDNPDPWLYISCLVFTDWSKIASNYDAPTWDGDVQAVLSQYGWLYPYMNSLIALGDYDAVSNALDTILTWMTYPLTDPRHMPVTRDFSQSKLQMLQNWQANGAPRELTSSPGPAGRASESEHGGGRRSWTAIGSAGCRCHG